MSGTVEHTTSNANTAGASPGLSWPLVALLREWTNHTEAATVELPHGMRGYQVLRTVVHDTPPTQAALATRLGIDRTVLTYLIDRYVDCGLVERRQDPADRRARRIVATTHGQHVLADVDGKVSAAEEQLLSGLRPTERTQFRELLERAAHNITPDEDRCAAVSQTLTARAAPAGRDEAAARQPDP